MSPSRGRSTASGSQRVGSSTSSTPGQSSSYSSYRDNQESMGYQATKRARRASPVYEDYRGPERALEGLNQERMQDSPLSDPRSEALDHHLPRERLPGNRSSPNHERPRSRIRNEESLHTGNIFDARAPDNRLRGSELGRRSHSPLLPQTMSSRSPTTPPTVPWRRSPSPLPPRLTAPSPKYKLVASQPSLPLPDPVSSRKLLVLDLNGNLVLRGARSHYAPYTSGPRPPPAPLRSVFPRPYLASFRDYIFHPETEKWLDTMVWSSAQPHSVNDMVHKAFGEMKERLIAVWARDTLGLTSSEYHNKTQTTKNLDKPWAELPSGALSSSLAESSSEPPAPATLQRHSARTTLLMDDSPLKAVLQPWNHLCVHEYGQEMRKRDLAIREAEVAKSKHPELIDESQERTRVQGTVGGQPASSTAPKNTEASNPPLHLNSAQRRKLKRQLQVELKDNDETDPTAISVAVAGGTGAEDSDMLGLAAQGDDVLEDPEAAREARKQRRQIKKQMKKELQAREAAELTARATARAEAAEATEKEPQQRYDETLLAVIGVVDTIKHQDNVAGWMKHGGLLQIEDPSSTAPGRDTSTPPETSGSTSDSPGLKIVRGSHSPSGTPQPSPRKKRRISNEPSDSVLDSSVQPEPPSSPGAYDLPPQSSQVASLASSVPSSPARPSERESGIEEQATTGIPMAATSSPMKIDPALTEPAASPGLWFEHPHVFRHWAGRGRKTCEELGIKVRSGVVGPNEKVTDPN